jgi:hypothetical protein
MVYTIKHLRCREKPIFKRAFRGQSQGNPIALIRQRVDYAFTGANPAGVGKGRGMPMCEQNLEKNPFKPEVKNIHATLSLMNRKKEGKHVATSCK